MGLVLASENQEWWSRLNEQYTRFVGTEIEEIKQVESGEKAKANQINAFLKALGGLKNYDYARAIDWSNYDEELLKKPGNLIKLITTTNITTTLDRLNDQCAYDAHCENYSDGSGNSNNGNYSDNGRNSRTSDTNNSDCTNETVQSEKAQSSWSTEPSGHADSVYRSQGDTVVCDNVSHNKNTT